MWIGCEGFGLVKRRSARGVRFAVLAFPGSKQGILTHGDNVATVRGELINQPFQKVDYLFGKPKAVVTVRYNKSGDPANLPR